MARCMIGMTNCGTSRHDDHCYISAYDAKTGKRVWKFVTVALKGQPGGDTWGDLPDDQRAGAETWIAGTYDPELNTTYWGMAQAKPWRRDLRGSGDGATDLCQFHPGAGSRYRQAEMVSSSHAPGEIAGPGRSVRARADRSWRPEDADDHRQGRHPVEAGPRHRQVHGLPAETVFQNVYGQASIPRPARRIYRKDILDQKVDQWLSSCPGPEGGNDWQAASYHQPTDTMIIPLSQSCVLMLGNGLADLFRDAGHRRQYGPAVGLSHRRHEAALELPAALAVPDRRAVHGGQCRPLSATSTASSARWTSRPARPCGRRGWAPRCRAIRSSFSVDGKQYIAVTTGLGGGSPERKAEHHADRSAPPPTTARRCTSSPCRTASDHRCWGAADPCDPCGGHLGQGRHDASPMDHRRSSGDRILVNYIDRISLSVAAPQLQHDFGLTPQAIGFLFSAFFWSYSLAQLPGGLLRTGSESRPWGAGAPFSGLRHRERPLYAAAMRASSLPACCWGSPKRPA